ncbi:cystatin-A [Oxyura jamaicensis]|uniref:cystatin-A n=1 Tax=Oxyura jamaicensis TaxID=8884 RepID=UPI0015A608D9|nr:cystatin-A [Oxyura jamaicensis]
MMPGGLSETKPATAETQHIVDQVKPQFESRENRTYGIFGAIEYRTQVVAGINYFIKVCMFYKGDYFVVKQYR